MVRYSASFCHFALAAVALITTVNAQSPTQTWNIAQATSGTTNVGCLAGLANQADPNGFYDDPFGARYAIHCQQNSNGLVYDNVGTSGQGAYGCSKGCDVRPNCKAWHYEGTQTSGTAGTGRCYFNMVLGQFVSNTSVYAGAELLSNGTPRLPCPYYNGTIFTDTQNYQWTVRCGFDTAASDTGTPLTTGTFNMTDCMRGCNNLLNAPNPCSQFSYSNSGSDIPLDGQVGGGNCYYKYGAAQEVGGGTVAVAYATRVATTPVAPSAATATTLSGSGAGQATTLSGSGAGQSISSAPGSSSLAPLSSFSSGSLTASSSSSSATTNSVSIDASITSASAAANTSPAACPAADQTITAGNSTWAVRCGSDIYGSDLLPNQATTNGYAGCFPICDATPDCAGFSFAGASTGLGSGTCYLKAAYSSGPIVFFGTAVVASYRIAGSGASSPAPDSSSSSSSMSTFSSTSTAVGTSPTAVSPAGSYPPPGSCPGVNGTVVADPAGILYDMMCQSDIYGSDLPPFDVTTAGYQDCFATCDSSALCAGFTWLSNSGSTTGSGAGTCYYKQQLNGVTFFQRPNGVDNYPNNVAAIKGTYGQTGAAPSFASTSATSIQMSISSSTALTSTMISSTSTSASASLISVLPLSNSSSSSSSNSVPSSLGNSTSSPTSSVASSSPLPISTLPTTANTSSISASSSIVSSSSSAVPGSPAASTSPLSSSSSADQSSTSVTQSTTVPSGSGSSSLLSSTNGLLSSQSSVSSETSMSSPGLPTSSLSSSSSADQSSLSAAQSTTSTTVLSSSGSSSLLSSSNRLPSSQSSASSTTSIASPGLPTSSSVLVSSITTQSAPVSSSLSSQYLVTSSVPSVLSLSQPASSTANVNLSTTSSVAPASCTGGYYGVATGSCPADDGKTVTDSTGVQYYIGCDRDIPGQSAYPNRLQTTNFADCFIPCSNGTFTSQDNGQGVNVQCYGFSYFAGFCYFQTFSGQQSLRTQTDTVAIIRPDLLAGYVAPAPQCSQTIVLSSTSSSSTVQTSSSTLSAGVSTTSQSGLPSSDLGFSTATGLSSWLSSISISSVAPPSPQSTLSTTGVVVSSSTATSLASTSSQSSTLISGITASSQFTSASGGLSSSSLQASIPSSIGQSSALGSSGAASSSLLSSYTDGQQSSTIAMSTSLSISSATNTALTGSSPLTSTNVAVTTTSSSSSVNIPQAVATATGLPQFSCPGNNQQIVQDNCGVSYILGCNNQTVAGAAYPAIAATDFNDCFALCSSGSVGVCISWTWFQNFCYLKAPSYGNDRFNGIQDGVVAGINIDYYNGPDQPLPASTSRVCASGAPTPVFSTTWTTTTTTTSSLLPPVLTSSVASSSSQFFGSTPQSSSTSLPTTPSSSSQVSSSSMVSSISQASSSSVASSSSSGPTSSPLPSSNVDQVSSSSTVSSIGQISSSLQPSSMGLVISSSLSSMIQQPTTSPSTSSLPTTIAGTSSSVLSSASSNVVTGQSSSQLSSVVVGSSPSSVVMSAVSSSNLVSSSSNIGVSSSQLSSAVVGSSTSSVIMSAVSSSNLVPSSSNIGVSSSLPLSSSQMSSSLGLPQESSSVGAITSASASQTSAEQISTTSSTPVTDYTPPPACPTGTAEDFCDDIASNSTCATDAGTAYNVTCGFAFTGTPINDSQVILPPPYDTEPFVPPTERRRSLHSRQSRPFVKRVPLPDIATCQQACDLTPDCKGVNFINYNCTLLSDITGTEPYPGAVTAEIVPYPEAPPGYVTASSTYMTSTLSSSAVLATSTSEISSPSPNTYVASLSFSRTASSQSPSSLPGPVTIIVTPVPSPTPSTRSSGSVQSSSSSASSANVGPPGYSNSAGVPSLASTSLSLRTTPASSNAPPSSVLTFSGSPVTSSSGGASSTSSAGVAAATDVSCPRDDGRNYTGNSGSYWVECDMAIGGTPLDNNIANNYKRQAVTPAVCMFGCEIYGAACVAANFRQGGCEYFSTIDTLSPSEGTIALIKANAIAGSPSGYPTASSIATSTATPSTQSSVAGSPSGNPGQSGSLTRSVSQTDSVAPPSQYPGVSSPASSIPTTSNGFSSLPSTLSSGTPPSASPALPSSYPNVSPATSSSVGPPSGSPSGPSSPMSSIRVPSTLTGSGTLGSSTSPPRTLTVTVCKNIRTTTVFPTYTVTTCTAGQTCATAVTRM